jgi:N-acetylglucosaminyl-diphospho-decaprenol L-rhamnosyltransferase
VKLAIIIVNYRTPSLTLDAVESVMPQLGADDRVYVVDGHSQDDSVEKLTAALAGKPQIEFMPLTVNRGFAFGNNEAIRKALATEQPPDLILLLNPDTVVRDAAVTTLVEFMQAHPKVGLAGSRLEDPDGTTQLAARRFHGFWNELEEAVSFGPISKLLHRWHISEPEQTLPHPTDWVPGAALMIRREVFEKIGLMDESFFLYFEEVDFCYRAKQAGFECWYVPQSRVIHFVGQSSGVTSARPGRRPRYWFESRARFWLKHYGIAHKFFSDLAWAGGRSLFHLRSLIQRKPNPYPPKLLQDFVRFNFGSRDAWKR